MALTVTVQAPVALPSGSPVNTVPVIRDLSPAALLAGVAIYGDETAQRYTRAMMFCEGAISRGEQLIVFDYGTDAFGLNQSRGGKRRTAHQMLRIGRNLHGYTPQADHGGFHGAALEASRKSAIYDLDVFDYDQTTRFLADFFQKFVSGSPRPATIVLPAIDAMIARRRHGSDSKALRHIFSLMQRGKEKGIKFVIMAGSADEIPQEMRNVMRTPVVARSTSAPQISALDKLINSPIKRYHHILGMGVAYMALEHHWAWPVVDAAADLPILLPHLALTTDAGGGNPVDYDTTTDEGDLVKDVQDAAAEAKPKDGAPETGKAAGTAAAAKTATAPSRRKKRPEGAIAAVRQRSAAQLLPAQLAKLKVVGSYFAVDIARTMLKLEAGKTLPSWDKVEPVAIMAYVLGNRKAVERSSAWLQRAKPSTGKFVSPCVLGAAHYLASKDDETRADAFFDALAHPGTGPTEARALLTALMKLSDGQAPLLSQRRLDMIQAAWTSHLAASSATPATNAKTATVDAANDEEARAAKAA